MKVIDLLNKIANGEEVPRKIKSHDQHYQLIDSAYGGYKDYISTLTDKYLFDDKWNLTGNLDEEVEIIEEDKKIEYIECYFKNGEHYIEDSCFRVQPLEDLELNQNEIVIIDKINEIIKKINKLETK